MAINKFAVGKMREFLFYIAALMLYSFILHLLGVEPDTFGDGWPMFGYYLVLNILVIPTVAFLTVMWEKHIKKNRKRY